MYESYKIIDSKITKLEKIAAFDGIFSFIVEIWGIEYRLKPDANLDVMPGGMSTDKEWIAKREEYGQVHIQRCVQEKRTKNKLI
jgi:hypothetical protein